MTRISEIIGLDKDNRYELVDLFSLRMEGKKRDGTLITSLEPTGKLPTFAKEPFEHGLDDRVKHSKELWTKPERKRTT